VKSTMWLGLLERDRPFMSQPAPTTSYRKTDAMASGDFKREHGIQNKSPSHNAASLHRPNER
jgi:hypothetical protein